MHRNRTEENGLGLSALGEGQVPGCCEYANRPSDSKKCQERLAYSSGLVFKILSRFILLREGNLYVHFPRRIDKRAEAGGDNTVV